MYRVKIKSIYESPEEVIGHANGRNIPDGDLYFKRMSKGEIIKDAPVFDYFFLQSFGNKEDWEWKLQDVHGFIDVGSRIVGWYVSDKFKYVVENLEIAKEYCFYSTKLLYRSARLDYWIFQFEGMYGAMNKSSYVDFEKSVFYNEANGDLIPVDNYNDLEVKSNEIGIKYNYEKELKPSKIVLNSNVDFIPLNTICGDIIVSDKFKNEFEKNGLEGLIFEKIQDYQVVSVSPSL